MSNQWWKVMVKRTIELTGRTYSDEDFDRYYLRVFQHYGSPQGYELLPDALMFLEYVTDKVGSVGIVSNCPARTVEDVIPMLGIHDYFKFFLCAETFGGQKPDFPIYGEALRNIRFWGGGDMVKPEEILHIGDNEAADYAGARAAGFQACFLNRSSNVQFNEWLVSPDFPGKSAKDLQDHTYADFNEIRSQMSHLP
jgi:HAD superfamily hydrolase (TIGR01549 family)